MLCLLLFAHESLQISNFDSKRNFNNYSGIEKHTNGLPIIVKVNKEDFNYLANSVSLSVKAGKAGLSSTDEMTAETIR